MQSTLARELAAVLNVPCVLLDTIYWLPGWEELPRDDFRRAVRAALEQDPRGWVVDGMYTSALGTMVSDEATDVICECPSSSFCSPENVRPSGLRTERSSPVSLRSHVGH